MSSHNEVGPRPAWTDLGTGRCAREERAWWITSGVVSPIAGIVVASAPASSLNTLDVLLGTGSSIIMGIYEIIGGFMLRRAFRATQTTPA
jgi:uncharacterized membrane protein HdeD (DUF308 family)